MSLRLSLVLAAGLVVSTIAAIQYCFTARACSYPKFHNSIQGANQCTKTLIGHLAEDCQWTIKNFQALNARFVTTRKSEEVECESEVCAGKWRD